MTENQCETILVQFLLRQNHTEGVDVKNLLTARLGLLYVLVFGVNSKSQVLAAEVHTKHPSAIEAVDVPIVPAEIFTKLAQYQSVRGSLFRGWAPDGTGILINTPFANSSQLHRVYEPDGRREQITFATEPVLGSFIPKSTDGAI